VPLAAAEARLAATEARAASPKLGPQARSPAASPPGRKPAPAGGQYAINNMAYGFPYDDYAGQSSDISVSNPQYLIVAVGW
jgi:hypothetical protein